MKNILFVLLLIPAVCVGQRNKTTKLGLTTPSELQMKVYEKDTTANAVVLYEHANLYIDESNKYDFRTDFYHRVKLLTKESFDRATISIPLYKSQRAINIKAITYNLFDNRIIRKVHLLDDKVFKKQTSENWKEVTFTMPNVKEGSVIEYVYSVISPYSQLDDWYFQSDIPKVKSEYTSAILGNWQYNIRIIGFLGLDKDEPSVKKNCVYVPGIGQGACSILSYGMKDIPAFKEEDYMLSKKNFMSRLVFDLISFTESNGMIKEYTKSWKSADKSIRNDYLDGQTSKKSFFRKNLPPDIVSESNDLQRAIKLYQYTQDRYTWNDRYWTAKKLKVKNTYKDKTGSVDAINLILYNSLQAVKIESYLVMLSTRANGLPTKLIPVITDFNYLVVKVVIDGKEYFLDATNKNLPFGLLPPKCLNGEGRVLDFKKGSYWQSLASKSRNSLRTKVMLRLEEDGFRGNIQMNRTGYFAYNQRKKLDNKTEDEYLDDFESDHPAIEVVNHRVKNQDVFSKPLQELLEVYIEEDFEDSENLRINPFVIGRTIANPFKLEQRDYPVDFGYTRNTSYLVSLTIPENYTITKLPPNKSIALPNKGGSFSYNIKQKGNVVNLFFRSTIGKVRFSNVEYFYLKEFFKQMIEAQSEFIELKKNE